MRNPGNIVGYNDPERVKNLGIIDLVDQVDEGQQIQLELDPQGENGNTILYDNYENDPENVWVVKGF